MFPKGTYLGGIRTLEDLRVRCSIDPDTGCWQWKGAMNDGKHPRFMLFDPERGEHRVVSGVQGALMLAGRCPPKGKIGYRRCTSCSCMNPAHMSVGTKAEQGAFLRRTGRQRGDPRRAAVNTLNSRTHRSSLTDELVQWVRESDQPNTVVAHALGVSHNCISQIRRGLTWRLAASNASVFAWRGAAA